MTVRSYLQPQSRKTLRIRPTSFVNDPDHWRARAEYMRAAAKMVADFEANRKMRRIADDYEELAEERLLSDTHALNDPVVVVTVITGTSRASTTASSKPIGASGSWNQKVTPQREYVL